MKPAEFFTGLLGMVLSIAGFVIGAAFVLWIVGMGFKCLTWFWSFIF